jgi:septum site-determining protein MinC
VSNLVRQRNSLMFRPSSYMVFATTPQPPIVHWLSEVDASLARSEGFFAGQHVALDLSTSARVPSASSSPISRGAASASSASKG